METEKYTNTIHLGRKIERVRRLRGMTQAELGDLLGMKRQSCIIRITSTRIAVLKVLSVIQVIIRPLIVFLLNR